jgi:hypothetical protein
VIKRTPRAAQHDDEGTLDELLSQGLVERDSNGVVRATNLGRAVGLVDGD